MFRLQKITKQLLARGFIIIVVAFVIVEMLVIALTHRSYYSTAQQQVKTDAAVIINALKTYSLESDANFAQHTR